MPKLRCVVERITYQNPENGYSVMKVKVKGYNDLVTLVGNLLEVPAGSVLLCEGDWKLDKRYGSQFVCQTWEEVMPATIYGIEKYLGSGLVKGIGPKFAQLIVRQFGLDTIEVIETDIERLYEVPGIGRKRVEKIRESWEKQKDIKNVMLFLQGYGVSTAYAAKIYRQYGKESIDKVKEDPYRLADDIWGIGFKTADGIAGKMGYGKNDLRRCKSGLIYTLNQLANEGHVYAEEEQLVKAALELLEADEAPIREALADMARTEDLKMEDEAIYLPPFYYAETGTANRLLALLRKSEGNLFASRFNAAELSKETGITYDEVQWQAIGEALRSKVMVLTGGPGTGKTTTTQGIIAALKHLGLRILLAAPTGRAAKRMSEATSAEAKTIHRLLETVRNDGELPVFGRNARNPLDEDVFILDESSMLDILLTEAFLRAIKHGARLIFVGDADQLPSVGAGNVLGDMIHSGCLNTVRLNEIFRQSESSLIVTNAHRINAGVMPELSARDNDFFFLPRREEQISATIADLMARRLPRAYGESIAEQMQLITPSRRGGNGTESLNALLQKTLNPPAPGKAEINLSTRTFRQGDRVMQIRNNYAVEWLESGAGTDGVFNGDVGIVESVDPAGNYLDVRYDERHLARYDRALFDELELAYAITVHKSQGSEYGTVIIPLYSCPPMLKTRNLLYTAVTRARTRVILVGRRDVLEEMVHNNRQFLRYTLLSERLRATGETR